MHIKVDITEADIREAIRQYINRKFEIELEDGAVIIEVKSKQNYRSEWEQASFRGQFTLVK